MEKTTAKHEVLANRRPAPPFVDPEEIFADGRMSPDDTVWVHLPVYPSVVQGARRTPALHINAKEPAIHHQIATAVEQQPAACAFVEAHGLPLRLEQRA